MQTKSAGRVLAFFTAALFFEGALTDSAFAQTVPKLRYGFEEKQEFYYEVKITAESPRGTLSYEGVFHYAVANANEEAFHLKSDGVLHRFYIFKSGTNGRDIDDGPIYYKYSGNVVMEDKDMLSRLTIGSTWSQKTYDSSSDFEVDKNFAPPQQEENGDEKVAASMAYTRQGISVSYGKTSPLPFLLDNAIDLVVESAPDSRNGKWENRRSSCLAHWNVSDEDSRFRESMESAGIADEKDYYAVLDQKNTTVRIAKRSFLNSSVNYRDTDIDMAGEGEFQYDKKAGIITSKQMQYNLQVPNWNAGAVHRVTLDVHLLNADEAGEKKKELEARTAREKSAIADRDEVNKSKVLDPGKKEAIERDLKSGDKARICNGVLALREAARNPNNSAEFSQALCEALQNASEEPLQLEILDALEIRAGDDAEKVLRSALLSQNRLSGKKVRGKAIRLLGQFKTVNAAAAAAAQMQYYPLDVEFAMKKMGPIAESAAIGQLNNPNSWRIAVRILKEIGGAKTLRAFDSQNIAFRDNALDVLEAENEITRRLKGPKESYAGIHEKINRIENDRTASDPKSIPITMRTWRDDSGEHQIKATFIELKDGKVRLKKDDGSTISIALEKLSELDKTYVKKLTDGKQSQP